MIALCELYTLQNYRLARSSNRMEYRLEEAAGSRVEMVRWTPGQEPHQVDPLEEDGNLYELGSIADAPIKKLVEWVSTRGLLGFRHLGKTVPQLGLSLWIIPGAERFHGPEHRVGFAYEPLELITEGAKVAAAATALYWVLSLEDGDKRGSAVSRLIRMNPGTRIYDQVEMSVLGVPIGLHRPAKNPKEWTALGIAGLSDLTDRNLGSEFTLYWSGPEGLKRKMTSGWKAHSLFGALFLKMASHLREARFCTVCRKPLDSRAPSHAQTCSSTCRKRLNRHPEKYV